MVTSLILLNLAGGESVEDLRVLEKDEGLGRVLSEPTQGMRQRERRATTKMAQGASAECAESSSRCSDICRKFHYEEEETKSVSRQGVHTLWDRSFGWLKRVNAEMVGFFQSHTRHTGATLDMDATLVETHKQEALYSYKKHKAYQPLSTYWAEADQIVHSEFRAGNCTGGLSAASGAEGVVEVHTFRSGRGDVEVRHGRVSEGASEVLRGGQRRTIRGDRVCRGGGRYRGVQAGIGEVAEEEWYELRRRWAPARR